MRIFFLWLLAISMILSGAVSHANSAKLSAETWAQASRAVSKALKSRDGVVLWWDHQTGAQKILGNPRLLKQGFLPGSIMKLLTAEAALAQGLGHTYHCQGHQRFPLQPNQSRETVQWCWQPNGHGELSLSEALAYSCNLYFAELAARLDWLDFKKTLQQYSFSAAKDLPTHPPPLNLFAIGEATKTKFLITPKEIADFWQQYLNKLNQPSFQSIRRGLILAGEHGSAKLAAKDLPFKILVKTGTADSTHAAFKTNAWLLAAYPAVRPRYGLVIFLKNAHAYEEAARLGQKLMKLLF